MEKLLVEPSRYKGSMPISQIKCRECGITKDSNQFEEMRYYDMSKSIHDVCKDCKPEFQRKEQLTAMYGGNKIHRLTIETFIEHPAKLTALNAIKEYKNENLYLWGSCGTGKSHLAGAVMNKVTKKNVSRPSVSEYLNYTTPAKLNRSLRGLDSGEEEMRLNKYIKIPMLVIDELGFKQDSDFSRQIIYEILDGRDRMELKRMIITSNHNLDQLSAVYQDDRIPSRIAGTFKIIEVGGDDMRVKYKGE